MIIKNTSISVGKLTAITGFEAWNECLLLHFENMQQSCDVPQNSLTQKPKQLRKTGYDQVVNKRYRHVYLVCLLGDKDLEDEWLVTE